jgi:hypothetical protein
VRETEGSVAGLAKTSGGGSDVPAIMSEFGSSPNGGGFMSAPSLLRHGSMCFGSAWVGLMVDTKGALIWRSLALAMVQTHKEPEQHWRARWTY